MSTKVISFILFSLCIALGASQAYDPVIDACLNPVSGHSKEAISTGIHQTLGKVELRTATEWIRLTVFVAIEAGGYCIQENSGIDKQIVDRVEKVIKVAMSKRINEAVRVCFEKRDIILPTTENCLIAATIAASDESIVLTKEEFRKLEARGQI